MGFADLHIHSIYSFDGTGTISAILKHVKEHTDLNVIAITDHDNMNGVQKALELSPHYGIEVIPGCEVSTADGHVIALYINRPVQAGLPLTETALEIGEQGGICFAAHPMARGVHSLEFETIKKALENPDVAKVLVGVEAFNGGLIYTRRNPMVEILAQKLPLAQLGNSDSHILETIGQGATEFPGTTASDLKAALFNRTTQPRRGKGLNGAGIIRSYIPRYVLRKLGWTAWNANPQSPMTYVRLSRALASVQIPAQMPGKN